MDADISFSLRFPFGSPSVILRLCGQNESNVREENGRKSWTLRFPFGSPSVMLVFSEKHYFQILFQVCPLFLGLTPLLEKHISLTRLSL